jgi:hypothetical protein
LLSLKYNKLPNATKDEIGEFERIGYEYIKNNHSKINMPDEEQNTACTPKSIESFFGTYNILSHTPDLDHQLHLLNKETWKGRVLGFWRKRKLNYPYLAMNC